MSVEQGASRAVRVDAHQHFWDPTTADYPWMSDAPDVVRRPYGPDDLTPLLAAARIDATVVVQARLSMDETRALLRTAAEVDAVAGVVGWVDLTAGDVARSVAELRGGPGGTRLVGLRHHANEEPDPRWLCRPDVIRGLRLAAQAGLCFDLLVWPRELPAALDLAAMVPEVRLVLDHMGKPAVRDGLDEGWAQAIRGLGALGNVSVKLSGIATEAADRWSVDDLRPFVDVVLEAFGSDRTMFGSDWPVCLAATTYGGWLAGAEALTAGLSDAERADVFGETARRVYGLALPGRE